jgi:hypothetical protein
LLAETLVQKIRRLKEARGTLHPNPSMNNVLQELTTKPSPLRSSLERKASMEEELKKQLLLSPTSPDHSKERNDRIAQLRSRKTLSRASFGNFPPTGSLFDVALRTVSRSPSSSSSSSSAPSSVSVSSISTKSTMESILELQQKLQLLFQEQMTVQSSLLTLQMQMQSPNRFVFVFFCSCSWSWAFLLLHSTLLVLFSILLPSPCLFTHLDPFPWSFSSLYEAATQKQKLAQLQLQQQQVQSQIMASQLQMQTLLQEQQASLLLSPSSSPSSALSSSSSSTSFSSTTSTSSPSLLPSSVAITAAVSASSPASEQWAQRKQMLASIIKWGRGTKSLQAIKEEDEKRPHNTQEQIEV